MGPILEEVGRIGYRVGRRPGWLPACSWPVSRLAAQSDEWLEAQGRLTEPMQLRAGAERYEPIAWDDAFARIGAELRALASPNEAIFYTSGRTSNEAAFLWQLFARELGTNNMPDCSNLCHESSGTALKQVIGVGKGTVTLADFDEADAIFVIGQNPGSNHPRMFTTLLAAKRLVELGNLARLAFAKGGDHLRKCLEYVLKLVTLAQPAFNLEVARRHVPQQALDLE